MQIKNNQLYIGNVAARDIAEKFSTPLYVYDVQEIIKNIRQMKSAFKKEGVSYQVSYASKALSIAAVYKILKAENIHCDVVSGGELATVRKAGFPLGSVAFNGNNKSESELEEVIEAGIGTIIVDNFHEIDLLKKLHDQGIFKRQKVLIRISPGISAHTHKFISTGQQDSKFGFDLSSGQAKKAFDMIRETDFLDLLGLHAHIGSQIFDVAAYRHLAELFVDLSEQWNFQPKVLDFGGGFGIQYTEADDPLPYGEFIHNICDALKNAAKRTGLKIPEVWIEPGRSIVGPAGYSFYSVGSRKDIPGLRSYLAVDGGMGDNIRPALYQADYQAVLAREVKFDPKNGQTVALVGKYCESGDVLIPKASLPPTKIGDLVVLLDTGAYGYSMASNYNRNPRPGIVFVNGSRSDLVVKPETYQDITHLDLDYEV